VSRESDIEELVGHGLHTELGKPLRILFLMRSLGRGGAERQALNLAAGLSEAGWDVHIACFYADGALIPEFEEYGIPVIDLGKKHRWDLYRFVSTLRREIKSLQPDIVHSYLAGPNLVLGLCALLGMESRSIWGVRNSHLNLDWYDLFSKIISAAESWMARFPDLIISNSVAGKSVCIKRGFPQAKITVIPNGIDTDRFRPTGAGVGSFKTAHNIPPDRILVGMVARVDPMKGHDVFLQAASQLTEISEDWHFVCVGFKQSSFATSMSELADDLGLERCLTWVDVQDDVVSVYNALDILVSTSYDGEGFSNSIAEAMSCGCPCVATDVGDAAVILGDIGELVSASSPRDITDALIRIRTTIESGSSELGIRGRERIVDHFSIENLVSRSIIEFQAVVDE